MNRKQKKRKEILKNDYIYAEIIKISNFILAFKNNPITIEAIYIYIYNGTISIKN